MTKKLTLDFIKSEFVKEGYSVLSDTYTNSATPIHYLCPKGHTYKVSWNKWKQGRRCPYCSDNGRVRIVDINSIRRAMAKEGYTLLTDTYINSYTKLDYICPNGHKYSTSWDAWKSKGIRCGKCSGNSKKTLNEISIAFLNEKYTLLSTNYINAKQQLNYICPKKHKGSMTWSSWKSGIRCPVCSGKNKHSLDFIKNNFELEKYLLGSGSYYNGKQKLTYTCDNGHKNSMCWNNWQQGQRCPTCGGKQISRAEKDLVAELKKLGLNLVENDRNIITPYELDVFIPEYSLAIEYCGLYWHSELVGKTRNYHINKLNMCKKLGIRLITVFEDEWIVNKEIVLSRLKTILGMSNKNIYARKCVIEVITARQAKEFCNNNHLQGYGAGSSVKLGAFFNNKLVAVMTFSKFSIAKGATKKESGKWELHRFCSRLGYRIVGGASKLLRYFERNFEWAEIISYADLRWSDGNLYNKLLFEFDHNTKPNYWYFKSNIKRLHRFSLRKLPNEPSNVSEWQLRQNDGWNRIWDCGNLKFSKKLETLNGNN